jgi:hypothetical protein
MFLAIETPGPLSPWVEIASSRVKRGRARLKRVRNAVRQIRLILSGELLSGTLATAGHDISCGWFLRPLGEFGPLLRSDLIADPYASVVSPLRELCAFLGFALQVGSSSHVILTKISPIGSQPCGRNGHRE